MHSSQTGIWHRYSENDSCPTVSNGRDKAPKIASLEQAASMNGTASTSVVAAQRNDASGSSAMARRLAETTARPITSTLLLGVIASMSRSTTRN